MRKTTKSTLNRVAVTVLAGALAVSNPLITVAGVATESVGESNAPESAGGSDTENHASGSSDNENSKGSDDSKDGEDSKGGEDSKSGEDSKDGEDSKSGADSKDGEDSKSGADSKDGEDSKSGADSKDAENSKESSGAIGNNGADEKNTPDALDSAKDKQNELNELTGNDGDTETVSPKEVTDPELTDEQREQEAAANEKEAAETNAKNVTPTVSENYEAAVQDASAAASSVETVVKLKEVQTAEKNVKNDQNTIDKAVKTGEKNVTDAKTNEESAKAKAAEAKAAETKAREALDKALSIDVDTVDLQEAEKKGEETLKKAQEVHAAVEEANTAAATAKQAAADAKTVVENTRRKLAQSVKTYNEMAEKYNLPSRYEKDADGHYVLNENAVTLEKAMAEAKANIETSKKSLEAAEKSYTEAAKAAEAAEAAAKTAKETIGESDSEKSEEAQKILDNVSTQKKVLDDMAKPMKELGQKVDETSNRYEAVENELKENREPNRGSESNEEIIDLSALKNVIDSVNKSFQEGLKALTEAQTAQKAAENLKNWANLLSETRKTVVAVQAEMIGNKKVYAYENNLQFDQTDGEVKNRDMSFFRDLYEHDEHEHDKNKRTRTVIDVPYSILRQYVTYAVSEGTDSTGKEKTVWDYHTTIQSDKGGGPGVAMKLSDVKEQNTVMFWELAFDEDDYRDAHMTGKVYVANADGSAPEEMESGTYFVAYAFKHQGDAARYHSDGFHLDGVLYQYEKPETPTEPTEEPTNPSEEPTTPSEDPTDPSEEPTTPSEEPTTPSEEPTTPSEEPAAPSAEPETPITPDTPHEGGNGGSGSGSGSGRSSNEVIRTIKTPNPMEQTPDKDVPAPTDLTELTTAIPATPMTGIGTPVPMEGAPQTGDASQMLMWEALSILSAAALGAYWFTRKKNNDQK